jgi:hypothetical protein
MPATKPRVASSAASTLMEDGTARNGAIIKRAASSRTSATSWVRWDYGNPALPIDGSPFEFSGPLMMGACAGSERGAGIGFGLAGI